MVRLQNTLNFYIAQSDLKGFAGSFGQAETVNAF